MKFFFIITLIVCSFQVSSKEVYSGKLEMNGIKFKDYVGFEKKWKLVTVRFREDSKELRWVFANDIAWKTLEKGSIEYPEGAVFAKIGIVTQEDSQFVSSKVPSGAQRFQFMFRNKEKYKDTDGWGYALFDRNGKTNEDDPVTVTNACFACHQLVQNRGQIFSQPFLLTSNIKLSQNNLILSSNRKTYNKIGFKWVSRSELPAKITGEIPSELQRLRMVSNIELQENVFQGTLDEIKPTLENEAYNYKTAAIFVSKDKTKFSVVSPSKKEGCSTSKNFKVFSTTLDGEVVKREYCNP